MQRFLEITTEAEDPRMVPLTGTMVVGSSANADLTIEGCDELASEHLSIEPSDVGCRVSLLRDAVTPILVDGMHHADGVLPWGAEILVGRVRIRLLREEKTAAARPSLVLLLTPVVLGLALWMLSTSDGPDAIPEAPPAPEIFAELPTRCDEGGTPSHHRAERNEAAADARRQRYPFDARDGVAAVRLYTGSGFCYAGAGYSEEAASVGRRATQLRQRVEGDYDTARFRLGRALSNEDRGTAISEARLLLALLEGRDDPYVEWLILIERRLRLAEARESRESS